MFEVTIAIAKRNGFELCEKPWKVAQKGVITAESAITKTAKCRLNGVEMNPGDRIIVEGETHSSMTIAVCQQFGKKFRVTFDWDGRYLTEFRHPSYAAEHLPIVSAL